MVESGGALFVAGNLRLFAGPRERASLHTAAARGWYNSDLGTWKSQAQLHGRIDQSLAGGLPQVSAGDRY